MEEKDFFITSDGLKLCGILSLPKKETSKCIVLCHGITVDKEESGIFTDLANELTKVGFAVFRFDFRGHGESEGRSIDMTIAGEEIDLASAVEFLINKGFETFGLVSASFSGGAVSFYVIKNQNIVKALCLWNALVDYGSGINSETEWGRKYWGKPALQKAEKFGFTEIGNRKFKIGKNLIYEVSKIKPWRKLLKILTPTLFIHGDKDTYVPYRDSVKYAKLMKNAKLITIKGAEHGFHDRKKDSELAYKATADFFLENL